MAGFAGLCDIGFALRLFFRSLALRLLCGLLLGFVFETTALLVLRLATGLRLGIFPGLGLSRFAFSLSARRALLGIAACASCSASRISASFSLRSSERSGTRFNVWTSWGHVGVPVADREMEA